MSIEKTTKLFCW